MLLSDSLTLPSKDTYTHQSNNTSVILTSPNPSHSKTSSPPTTPIPNPIQPFPYRHSRTLTPSPAPLLLPFLLHRPTNLGNLPLLPGRPMAIRPLTMYTSPFLSTSPKKPLSLDKNLPLDHLLSILLTDCAGGKSLSHELCYGFPVWTAATFGVVG